MKVSFDLKWMALEITPRCNLSCVHCRTSASMNLQDKLSFDEITTLIDEISTEFKPVIVLTGGEPLLREDVFEIARYIKSRGMRVGLATNGTLVNETMAKRIKRDIDIVSLSLDGSTAEIHDNFRGVSGAFNSLISAIHNLKKEGVPFLINSSFTKRNQNDIENVYKLAKSFSPKAWYMFMIVPTGRAEELRSELISMEDYFKILKWHFYTELKEKEMLIRPTCAPQYYAVAEIETRKHNLPYSRRTLSFSTGGAKGCVAAQKIAFVDYEGNVKPCSYFLRTAGNIKEKHFLDICHNSEIFTNLRDFSLYNKKCSQCPFIETCGGCRARADAYHGDYLAEDPYCFLNRDFTASP